MGGGGVVVGPQCVDRESVRGGAPASQAVQDGSSCLKKKSARLVETFTLAKQ